MIASLNGKVIHVEEGSLVVEVGGVGLLVSVPNQLSDKTKPGQIVLLHTQLIVRQDNLSLYGFDTVEVREFFDLLLSVGGIGPRLSLTILSTLTPDSIRRGIINEQAEVFSRVSGVGMKTAQKIIFSLQDKVKTIEGYEPIAEMSEVDREVLSALISLGYSVVEAQASMQSIPSDASQDVETRLRIALAYFQ